MGHGEKHHGFRDVFDDVPIQAVLICCRPRPVRLPQSDPRQKKVFLKICSLMYFHVSSTCLSGGSMLKLSNFHPFPVMLCSLQSVKPSNFDNFGYPVFRRSYLREHQKAPMGCTARFENLTILKWSLKGIPWNSQEKIAIFSWARRCLVLRRSRRLSVGKNLEQLETDGQQWIGIWINFVFLYVYIYIFWTRENQSQLCKADLDILGI